MKSNLSKIYLAAAIAVFVLCAALLGLLYFIIGKESAGAVATLEEWKTENDNRNSTESLESSLASASADNTALDLHFVEGANVVPFLNMVERLAPQTNTEVKVNTVEIASDSKSLKVKVSVTGTFESIYKFLILFENAPYETGISFFEIHRVGENDTTKENNAKAEWSANMELRLLSYIKQ